MFCIESIYFFSLLDILAAMLMNGKKEKHNFTHLKVRKKREEYFQLNLV